MAKPGSVGDYLHDGVLEYSVDGQSWQQLTTFSGKPDVTATAPAGTKARYVRARATAGQTNWLVVREFGIELKDGAVVGGPPAATGSALRSAADGDLDTVYRAARAPEAGEALELGLGSARSVGSVTVLQPSRFGRPRRHPATGRRRNLAHRRRARRSLHQGEHDRSHS